MIRTIVLGWNLKRPAAMALAKERFETGGYFDVEVRVLLPNGLTKLARLWTKDKYGAGEI